MTTAEKVRRAREWYELGCCPGCGAPLEEVAGVGSRHYRGRDAVHGSNGTRTTYAGERVSMGGPLGPDDVRLCVWTADDLTSLVLIGSGTVKYDAGTGNAALVRERRDPAIASAIVSEGGNK